jgi:anion-transporting  ArsA/GET3 family ATPase
VSHALQGDTLFDRRLIFVVGKGGVGKTTVSVALARAAARLQKKALLVEVGDVNAAGPMFGLNTLHRFPEEIAPNISGARIDPKSVLDEYIHQFIGSTFIANRITHSQLFDRIATATPGLKEIMTLGQIWRWEQEQNDDDELRFDVIIVDAPATGHGLSLLRVPRVLVDMIRVGPIAEQTRWVKDLLCDPSRTSLAVVTLPEELPVNETIELHAAAREWLDMRVGATFINGVYPKTFTQREAAHITRLYKSFKPTPEDDGDFIWPMLEAARVEIARRELQQFYVQRLNKSVAGQLIEIPFFFTNELSDNETEAIANRLLQELSV